MFSNYYVFIASCFLALVINVLNGYIGIIGSLIIFIIFWIERNSIKNKMIKLENKACENIDKILYSVTRINFNIIERLSYDSLDSEKIKKLMNENINYMKSIFEKLQEITEYSQEIFFSQGGTYGVKSTKLYYINEFYDLINNLNIFEFYEKYKDADSNINIDLYRRDWLELYAQYRKEPKPYSLNL